MICRSIDAQTHEQFMIGSAKEHFMQTPIWGEIKSTDGWQHEFIGFYNDSRLCATALLLKKPVPVIKKYLYYSPRGPVADYTNRQQLADMTGALRQYLKSKQALALTIDPDVAIEAHDKYDNPTMPRCDLVEYLSGLGWKHSGFVKNFENKQPRYTFRLPLDAGLDALYDNCDRMARKNLKFADEAAIRIYPSDDLDRYFEIMRDTAERDNFYEGSPSYYRRLYPMLKDKGMAQLWFARYEPKENLRLIDHALSELDNEIKDIDKKLAIKPTPRLETKKQQAQEKRGRIEKQKALAQDYLDRYPDGLDLSTLITVSTPHRTWTVWGGSRSELRQFAANYKITWHAIEQACAQNKEFVDFFGSTGDPSPDNPITGIYAFKKKFSGLYTEFAGQFDLIVSPLWYTAWNTLSPLVLKARRLLRRRHDG